MCCLLHITVMGCQYADSSVLVNYFGRQESITEFHRISNKGKLRLASITTLSIIYPLVPTRLRNYVPPKWSWGHYCSLQGGFTVENEIQRQEQKVIIKGGHIISSMASLPKMCMFILWYFSLPSLSIVGV